MDKYKFIPFEIEAVQIGTLPFKEIMAWCGGFILYEGPAFKGILIKTNDTQISAFKSEWIAKHSDGNFTIHTDIDFKTNLINNKLF